MKIFIIYILTLIRSCFSCEDINNISILPTANVPSMEATLNENINLVCCHPDGADSLTWEYKNGQSIPFTNTAGLFSLKDEKNRLILRIDKISRDKFGSYTCKHKTRYFSRSVFISEKLNKVSYKFDNVELFFPYNKPIQIKCPLKVRQTVLRWTYSEGGKNIDKRKGGEGENYKISNDLLYFTIKMDNNIETIKKLWCAYQETNINGDIIANGVYEFKWTRFTSSDLRIVMENKEPILEGQDVNLACYFTFLNYQIIQFGDKSKGPGNESKIVLTIPKVTNGGEYECQATQFVQSDPIVTVVETERFRFDVVVPPKFIKSKPMDIVAKLGENAILICDLILKNLTYTKISFEHYVSNSSSWIKIIEDNERYEIKLARYNRTIDKHSFNLIIKNVKWEDRGKYRCYATNPAGTDFFVGVLKVEKSPDVYTMNDTLFMAMKPLQIDCSAIGFPISENADTLDLRNINETSDLNVKFLEKSYEETDGLRKFYEVTVDKNLIEGKLYLLQCIYHNSKKNYTKDKIIKIISASKPEIPKVEIVCKGTSGVVFKYKILTLTESFKDVVKNELFYIPSDQYDSISTKPSKVVPIKNDGTSEYYTYILGNLLPFTNYTFRWESYNSFQLSSFVHLYESTKTISPPKPPTSIDFSTKLNMINVKLSWDDDCPYERVNSEIKGVAVSIRLIDTPHEKFPRKWEWVESNITVDIEKSTLQFQIFIEKPQVNYEITVSLRSNYGSSKPIQGVYKAKVVLAGSLFSCFPYCSSQSLLPTQFILRSSLIASLVLLCAI